EFARITGRFILLAAVHFTKCACVFALYLPLQTRPSSDMFITISQRHHFCPFRRPRTTVRMHPTKVVHRDISRRHVFTSPVAIYLIVSIVFCSQLTLTKGDIFAGDRRDPYFTSRPNPIQNYGQWGHYPI